MSNPHFILNGREVQQAESYFHMCEWMGARGTTVLVTRAGPFRISTVFLGSGFAHRGDPPRLFETMLFDEHGDSVWSTQVPSFDEAEAAHQAVVQVVTRRWAWMTVPALFRRRRALPRVQVVAAGPDARRSFGLPGRRS